MVATYQITLVICQLAVLIYYIIQPPKLEKETWKSFLPTSKHLFIVNLCAVIAVFSINRLGQYFCVPVDWAAIVLMFFTISMLVEPLLHENSITNYVISFFHGIGFLICIYCIFFYGFYGLIAILLAAIFDSILFVLFNFLTKIIFKLFAINLSLQSLMLPTFFFMKVVGLPYFWLARITIRFISVSTIHKHIFAFACSILIAITLCFTMAYKNIIEQKEAILQMDKKVITELQSNFFTNYMLEKAIGFALVYHTEICIYDGWRPPMHDPFLVVASHFVGMNRGVGENLNNKIQLYKQLYPNVAIHKKCSCGFYESHKYFSDPIFKQ